MVVRAGGLAALLLLVLALVGGGAGPSGAAPSAQRPQGTIVYSSSRTGNFELYSVRADGSATGQLTRSGAQDARAAFSPDGRQILFMRFTEIDKFYIGELWVMNADGRNQRRLTTFAGDPAWSPDSRWIAYSGYGKGVANAFPLVIVGRDGRHRRVIRGRYYDPSWSPDGKRLVVTSDPDDTTDLVVLGADGRSRKTIRRNVGGGPVWLPNGLIAFTAADDGIDVVRPDGSGGRRLHVPKEINAFAWAPDGRRFAYTDGRGRLLVASIAGGRARDITPKGAKGLGELAWSSDGRWLVGRRSGRRRGDQGELFVVAADGSSARSITKPFSYPFGGDNELPSWRPGGAGAGRLGRAPAKPSPSEVASRSRLQAVGAVTGLAADGRRVAFTVAWSPSDCPHVSSWQPGTRPVHLDWQQPCDEDVGAEVTIDGPLALAGTHVAWTLSGASPSTGETDLYTASVRQPATVRFVEEATNTSDECCGGDFLGDLYGDRDLLVYDAWTQCSVDDPDNGSACKAKGEQWGHETIMNTRLWRIEGSRRVVVRAGRGSFQATSVDGGRIAVVEPSGAVDVVRADGSLVHRLPPPADEALSAQLSGSQLVVLTGGGLLRLYDAATGKPGKTVQSPGGALEDLDSGLAVLVRGRTVHVLRLADGHRVAITPPGRGPVFAQLEPSGLFVGYTVRSEKRRGRVDFTTRAQLERRLTR
jgi:Tol biopolymer transport system component